MLVHVVLMASLLLSNVYGGKQIFVGDSSAAAGGECWSFNVVDQLYSSLGSATTITSATPPAAMTSLTTTEPFFTQPGANSTYTGPYGYYSSTAVDNIVKRASFETCAGGHPTGWVVSEPGTSAIDCSTDHKAKGANSLKFVAPVGDQPETYSACVEVDKTKDYFFSMWMYGESGDENIRMYIGEYGATDCSGGAVASLYPINGVDIAAGWDRQTATIASGDWNGSTLAVKIHILSLNTHDAVTFYLDEVEFYQGIEKDSTCTCDTSVTCSCSAIVGSITTLATSGTWQFEATIQSPVDGAVATPVRQILHIPESAATDHNRVDLYWASDVLTFDVYTSAGVQKTATVALAGNADTAYEIKAYHSAAGSIAVCAGVPGSMSCGSAVAAVTMTTPNATTYIGCTDAVGGNVHIEDACWSDTLTDPLGS